MADAALKLLVEIGNQLFIAKLFVTAVHGLWFYDYLLTFADEIEYAWNGRRSWVFALFVAVFPSALHHLVERHHI